jgi:hypothetical protein
MQWNHRPGLPPRLRANHEGGACQQRSCDEVAAAHSGCRVAAGVPETTVLVAHADLPINLSATERNLTVADFRVA